MHTECWTCSYTHAYHKIKAKIRKTHICIFKHTSHSPTLHPLRTSTGRALGSTKHGVRLVHPVGPHVFQHHVNRPAQHVAQGLGEGLKWGERRLFLVIVERALLVIVRWL